MVFRRSAQLQEWYEQVEFLRRELEKDSDHDARILACAGSLRGIQYHLSDVLKDQLLEDFRQNAKAAE